MTEAVGQRVAAMTAPEPNPAVSSPFSGQHPDRKSKVRRLIFPKATSQAHSAFHRQTLMRRTMVEANSKPPKPRYAT
jgi:hypothetical protein